MHCLAVSATPAMHVLMTLGRFSGVGDTGNACIAGVADTGKALLAGVGDTASANFFSKSRFSLLKTVEMFFMMKKKHSKH